MTPNRTLRRAASIWLRVLPAVFLMIWSGAAQAVTLTFDQYVNGADYGATTIATLEADDVAGGVQMTLTNTAVIGGMNAYVSQLLMTYQGVTSGLSLSNEAGVATTSFQDGSFLNAGFPFDLRIRWDETDPLTQLNIGESSTFTILGASIADLFQSLPGTPFAMLQIKGLDNANATKYAASFAPIPLPAAGLMLLVALGLLGVARRRQA
ncbi:hypothetical protein JQU17_20080 [Ponticoccus sp. SC2-23]|uniref:PEP-CTERM sorting domain-containing protein n=1 Tax=Alexandriicola marinus TaxID=2081710 RepID=UPI000FD989EE|nr:PEP-CTERM sorting domain-containing protein [Alexandriicola marinus]MBM1222514.1 hypothetical protein [Ponticoccus sp. SC6-9]MBM1227020.1 hypothetical protein [Ponticoccus sp. SC6-15]MBM1231441.1 hypothetical protein [Ponticoccus sp. SC6-38]MBM1236014.1 hypothetical protein [Ponticoccus sp. SC6-45]MBM1240464.1 hypothetical protein [Ponticoccus sp. SC6-49]MBM1244999.1 hypothetical protein [Ponticoccus sp. SC2-64]MBM1249488.1 hypothetical protein [Ponticoccus sp. SC6-42]MBM1253957.1 hypoth